MIRGDKVKRLFQAIAVIGLLGGSAAGQSLLPNGQQTFTDSNGAPLAGGSVYFYVPGTTTAKYTYQDPEETVPNTNPIILNSAGRAIIWGTGLYREVVYDQFGTLIWDQITYGAAQSMASSGKGQHSTLVTASGVFVTPAYTDESTIFKFCGVGGGGGGGGLNATANAISGGGGGAGGGCLWVFGFPGGSTITIAIGAAGAAGSSAGGNGGSGGDTTLTFNGQIFFTAPGTSGGEGNVAGGAPGEEGAIATISLGSVGLTQVAFVPWNGGVGAPGNFVFALSGGSTLFTPGLNTKGCFTAGGINLYGTAFGGAGGPARIDDGGTGCAEAGFLGQTGEVTVEWVN